MRTTFIDELTRIAEHDTRVWLITADLGYSVLERFATRFPERYINAGVAEQNMTGVAAGLALSGKIVFTYSIANFPVFRCLEQIRNDVCYYNSNVKIVSVGGGFAYGAQGYTHHGLEDFAVMRALPNMTVTAPGDPVETRLLVRAVAQHQGPCYIRLGKAGEPVVHDREPAFALGRAVRVRDGGDVTLMSTGGMLKTVVEAAAILQQEGLRATVLSFPTLKPIDEDAIASAVDDTSLLATVEEHVDIGGLYSAVAETLPQIGRTRPLLRFSVPAGMSQKVGSQAYLNAAAGLTAVNIASKVRNAFVRLRSEEARN